MRTPKYGQLHPARLQSMWAECTCPPSPVNGGALPWWGVSEWCGRRGSSWRCPHSWCIHPPYLGWPGASRKNIGRHNTVGAETEAHTVLEATVLWLSAKIRTGLSGSVLWRRLGVAISRKRHWQFRELGPRMLSTCKADLPHWRISLSKVPSSPSLGIKNSCSLLGTTVILQQHKDLSNPAGHEFSWKRSDEAKGTWGGKSGYLSDLSKSLRDKPSNPAAPHCSVWAQATPARSHPHFWPTLFTQSPHQPPCCLPSSLQSILIKAERPC